MKRKRVAAPDLRCVSNSLQIIEDTSVVSVSEITLADMAADGVRYQSPTGN